MTDNRKREVLVQLHDKQEKLGLQQLEFISGVVEQFSKPCSIELGRGIPETQRIVSKEVAERIGDALQVHHVLSRQALSKDRFEFAFENALTQSGIKAKLARSRTNRGHDITVNEERISLKTQADANIKRDSLHISKFMELGQGKWELPLLMKQFFEHMDSYERIFQFRCLGKEDGHFEYELVEIPKALLQEARHGDLKSMNESTQDPKPGYCFVYGDKANKSRDTLKFALYFDGGSERKLQIKDIRKALCLVHATWKFQSTTFQEP